MLFWFRLFAYSKGLRTCICGGRERKYPISLFTWELPTQPILHPIVLHLIHTYRLRSGLPETVSPYSLLTSQLSLRSR